jgi:hypothetical protein
MTGDTWRDVSDAQLLDAIRSQSAILAIRRSDDDGTYRARFNAIVREARRRNLISWGGY